ncbi:hypothetical protein G6F32_014814 [Rhizopus arrhizus]|nr:hypothetical protein G6F32_014814 [Rhizopus arrhizus]
MVSLGRWHRAADHRFEAAAQVAGIGGLDHRPRQVAQHLLARRGLAAPPGRQRRQQQVCLQQAAAHGRQETVDGGRLQKARAQGIGHQHVAGPHDLQQPRHAQRGIRTQLQRVAKIVVQPAQHGVHAFQPVQRLQGPGVSNTMRGGVCADSPPGLSLYSMSINRR